MKISVVTPTANRLVALLRCEHYVTRAIQHLKRIHPTFEVEWIVADGSPAKCPTRTGHIHIHQDPHIKEPARNLCQNIINGVEASLGDIVVIMEDDDWYSVDYLVQVIDAFVSSDAYLVGFGNAQYYHLPSEQYRSMNNINHSSLCTTSFSKNIKDVVIGTARGHMKRNRAFIDMHLWKAAPIEAGRKFISKRNDLSLGIKGLPGRAGIGVGHRPRGKAWQPDPGMKWLKEKIGDEDFEFYESLVN